MGNNLFKFTSFLTFLLLLSGVVNAQGTFVAPAIGAGNNAFPFNTTSVKRLQAMYPAGSFTPTPNPVLINTIYFQAASASIGPTWNNFSITLIQTNDTVWANGNTEFVPGGTVVFSSPAYTYPSAIAIDGWFSFTLTTPFVYNPTQTLFVDVKTDGFSNGVGIRNVSSPAGTSPKRLRAPNPTDLVGTPDQVWNSFSFDGTPLAGTDAAAFSLISPTVPVSLGTPSNIAFNIANFAANTITSASVGYQLNNDPPVLEAWSGNIATTQSSPHFFTAPVTIPTGQNSTLKVWVTNPNGSPDINTNNDTLTTTFCPSLSGSYTIGGATADFATLSDAIAAMQCGGVSGPTTLNLSNGTYIGNFAISNIVGASLASPLTIQSLSGNRDSVIITSPGTGTPLSVTGIEGFTLSNLTVSRTNIQTVQEQALNLVGSNNSNILNCVFSAPLGSQTTLTTNRNVTISSSSFVFVSGCRFVGGYYGIYANGSSVTSRDQFASFLDNTFERQRYYGAYFLNHQFLTFSDNLIQNLDSTNVSAYHMYVGTSRDITVSNNRLTGTGGIYGIFLTNNDGDSIAPNKIFNNEMSIRHFSATPRSLYISGSTINGTDYYEIINNSVWLKTATTSATANGAFFFTGGSATAPAFTGVILLNNSIMVEKLPNSTTSALATMYFSYADMPNLFTSNHNNLYYENQGSAPLVRVVGVNHANLAAWNTATGKDAFSISLNPQYLSDTLLQLLPNTPNNALALPIGYITTDITGAPRDPSTPDVGAYEINVLGCTGPIGLSTDSLSFDAARIIWFSSQSMWNLEYGLQGFTPGTGTVVRGISTNPYLITGLSPNTDYQFYLQDSCSSGNSSWIGPATFRTLKDVDANLLGFINPRANGCADPAVPIQVSVRNDGVLPLTSFSVNLDYSGFISGNLNQTFTTNLGTGAIDTFTIGTLNLSLGGTLNLNALATVANDRDTLNNRKVQTSNIISVAAPIVSALADTVCIGQGATLSVTNPNPSISVGWFNAAGTQIGTGNTFVTPPITANTTFTARGLGNVEYPVGPADTSFGSAAAFGAASLSIQSMLINAIEPMKLIRTRVYPQNTGWLVIQLRTVTGASSAGTVVAQDSVFVTQTTPYAGITITCDLDIPIGAWQLGCLTNQSAGGMLRNSTGAVYPYSIPGKFEITGATFSPVYYYYFYGMVLSQGGCPTDSTLKTIIAKPSPIAAFTSTLTSGSSFSFDASTSQNANSYNWDFGDGSTGTGVTTNHTYATSGTYQVVLTVGSPNNCGTDTLAQSVTVQALPQPDLVMLGIISPTPSSVINSASPITVRYANIGTAPAPVFDIAYSVNGVSQNTNTITATIQPNDTVNYTFTQSWLPNQSGTFNICAYFNTADNNPSNDTSCVSVSSTVNVQNLGADGPIAKLYPNPAQQNLMLELNQPVTDGWIYIYDVVGKLMQSINLEAYLGNKKLNLDLSTLADGVYNLQLNTSKGMQTIRFVKTK